MLGGAVIAPETQGWCSWCCRWQYHMLVQECLLTRDVYECRGCSRRTLPCRNSCGAFSRGFDEWDEEHCAACEGRVCAWAEGCLITRSHVQGRCSWCQAFGVHFVHVVTFWGQQLHECSTCGRITQRCRRCPNFAKADSSDSETGQLCSRCSRHISDWPETLSQAQPVRSLYCSKCLVLQAHRPHSAISAERGEAVLVCIGCDSPAHVCCYCGVGSITPDILSSLLKLSLIEPPLPKNLPDACLLCCFVLKIDNQYLHNFHKRQAALASAAEHVAACNLLPLSPSISSSTGCSASCRPLPPLSLSSNRYASMGQVAPVLCAELSVSEKPELAMCWEDLSAVMRRVVGCHTVNRSSSHAPPANILHTMVRAPHNNPVKDQQRSKWMSSASSNAAAMLPALSSLLNYGRAGRLKPLSSSFFLRPECDPNDLTDLLHQLSPVLKDVPAAADLACHPCLLSRVIFCDALPPIVLESVRPLFHASMSGAAAPEFIACLGAAFRMAKTPTRFFFIVYCDGVKEQFSDNVTASLGKVVAVACYWIHTDFDMARAMFRYSGLNALSGLRVLGFNPLSLDLAFIQIPFFEQPGICFSSECSQSTQSLIIRDVHNSITSMHNPRVIATIQQSGSHPSRSFGSMDYGYAPYLPDTVLDLRSFTSFSHYQEAQPRSTRSVMRQRQRDFSSSKCCLQQWLWDDMDSDMRIRVAYMCACVAELHAVSGSPDLFQLTPELIDVISTLPNLQPTLGFKRSHPASTAPPTSSSRAAINSAPLAPSAASAIPVTSNAAGTSNCVSYSSNKQRKKALQQAKMEAWARAHADKEEAREILARTHVPEVQKESQASSSVVVPSLSTYEGNCSALSPCKWIVARRDSGNGGVGELVGAVLLVYSGDTAFGLFTGLDYAASKDCRAYFNLLYAMIDDAIAHDGVQFLRCGATTYYTKRRMGCQLEPVDLHYYVRDMPRALNSVVSAALTDAIVEAANFDG